MIVGHIIWSYLILNSSHVIRRDLETEIITFLIERILVHVYINMLTKLSNENDWYILNKRILAESYIHCTCITICPVKYSFVYFTGAIQKKKERRDIPDHLFLKLIYKSESVVRTEVRNTEKINYFVDISMLN